MEPIQPLLNEIKSRYSQVIKTHRQLIKQSDKLRNAGLDYGTPHYKQGKYLRIVKPSINGQREYVYVGADPEKQQAALYAIERGKDYTLLRQAADELEAYVDRLHFALQRAIDDDFSWSHSAGLQGPAV